jgi:hypothetical protein
MNCVDMNCETSFCISAECLEHVGLPKLEDRDLRYLYRDSGTEAEYIHIMDTILVIYEIFALSF